MSRLTITWVGYAVVGTLIGISVMYLLSRAAQPHQQPAKEQQTQAVEKFLKYFDRDSANYRWSCGDWIQRASREPQFSDCTAMHETSAQFLHLRCYENGQCVVRIGD